MQKVERVSWNWTYDLPNGGTSPVLRYSAWVECVPQFGWSLMENYGGPKGSVVSCYPSEEAAYERLAGYADAKQRFPYTAAWYDVEILYKEES